MAFKETVTGLIFENRHVSITIDKNTGTVTSVINLYTNEEIVNPCSFVYLEAQDESKINPTSAQYSDGKVKFTFENGMDLYTVIECFDDFFTVEIASALDTSVRGVSFANVKTTLTENCGYVLLGIGMTAWTKPVDAGYRDPAPAVYASAYTYFPEGVKGAKLGFAFSKCENAISQLKALMETIDPKVGLVSKAGGPWAKEWKQNYGDYAIIVGASPETIDDSLALCQEFGVDQYDYHQSVNSTFVQGDFTFAHTENGTAAEFRETIGKKIHDAGLISAMHTYAYYLSPASHKLLSNPYWQKQLRVKETYTLSDSIDADSVFIPTTEDASSFDLRRAFHHINTTYVLIDEEIIKVTAVSEDGFIECERGTCGTHAAHHEKAAVIKHLDGTFMMFTPELGNELFYHIADLTAKAYNEGGFDMLYFDAIDGVGRHLSDRRDTWYYHQIFIQRVLSQCERTPLIETSSGCPSEWNFRGREGAWDYAHFSIKKHIRNHVEANVKNLKKNMTTTIGWFNFFTDEHYWGNIKNANYKTLFHDDLDYLGKYALAYDMTMVYHPLPVEDIRKNPFYYNNLKYYTEHYTKLRKGHYFKNEIIERLKGEDEWRVVAKGNEFAVQQMYYEKANLGNVTSEPSLTFKGTNPYKKQMPFIRVEARHSTLFEEPVVIAKLSGEKATENKISVPTEISDIDMREAKSIRVKGTGRDGDAALISISGGVLGEKAGRIDHFIDLNFNGWRDFVLLDMDNGDYDLEKYPFDDIPTKASAPTTFRYCPLFTALKETAIRLIGETADKAEFTDLITYPHTSSPVKNPSVRIDNSVITFNCEINGGDYIEYDPETGKALLFHNMEQTIEEISFTGNLDIPEGEFVASYSAEAKTDAPVRARITLGFIGEELMN